MAKSTRFNFWIADEELEVLKKKSKKEGRSTSNFIKMKCGVLKDVKE